VVLRKVCELTYEDFALAFGKPLACFIDKGLDHGHRHRQVPSASLSMTPAISLLSIALNAKRRLS
jgi:hypothetical protein